MKYFNLRGLVFSVLPNHMLGLRSAICKEQSMVSGVEAQRMSIPDLNQTTVPS